jgi:hypothetical protein
VYLLCAGKMGIAASGALGGVAGQGLPVMKDKSVVVKGILLPYAHAVHSCVMSSDSNFVGFCEIRILLNSQLCMLLRSERSTLSGDGHTRASTATSVVAGDYTALFRI